jgi:hypothetical protein
VKNHGHRRLRRSLAPLLAALGLLILPAVASARWITISRTGSIGPLKLNVSSTSEIVQQWGQPAYETSGNVLGSSSSHYPNYELLGYGCRRRPGYTTCAINFYMSERTNRLESFVTNSPQFLLFGGVHAGMSADVASRREHRPNVSGCGQFVGISTPRLEVAIDTRGGTTHLRKNGFYVSGGRVASIDIDYKRYGVGVLFC